MLSLDYGKLLTRLADYYRESELRSIIKWKREMPAVLLGPAGCGKTYAAVQFASQVRHFLYFSFRNMSSDLALKLFSERHPDIFHECRDWKAFFYALHSHIGKSRQFSLIFDDWDEKRAGADFFGALSEMLKNHPARNIFVLLVSRKEPVNSPCYVKKIDTLSPADIKKSFPELSEWDRIRLFSITDGYPGLLSQYKKEQTFEDNLRRFLSPGNVFFRYAEEQMRELFRSPESYTSIFYGLAMGKERLTDLAEISRYSLNKCDKYLRQLIDYSLIERKAVKNGDRRSLNRYNLVSGYHSLWSYSFAFAQTEQEKNHRSCLDYIDTVLVPGFFRKECFKWIKRHGNAVMLRRIRLDEVLNYDMEIGGMHFDYVQHDGERVLFVKIWTDVDRAKDGAVFEEVIKAGEEECAFYDSEYLLFSIRRFTDKMWKIAQAYENVRLIEARFLSGSDKRER